MPIGSYTVTEGADPAGFQFDHVTCVASGAASQSTSGKVATVGITGGGGAVTCTYVNDQQLGAIKITKTSSKGDQARPRGRGLHDHPSGWHGVRRDHRDRWLDLHRQPAVRHLRGRREDAADGLRHRRHHEPQRGRGHQHHLRGDPYVGETFTAEDTPTSRIHVSFDDEGSGATSATISCDNTTGTTSTPSESGWDLTKQVVGIHAPTTVVCTIVIDP